MKVTWCRMLQVILEPSLEEWLTGLLVLHLL
ncbi:hypothetical protein MTR67_017819 [Solanum verrucosum]|uniref:Uncharacterized protein n=1 Tax=Solanum verrucosum TaxID=315347 RepID=A0AAF0QIM8_SOLVR|nr:hypothetical protein MTR67_017819 [Solanum verrucosum]